MFIVFLFIPLSVPAIHDAGTAGTVWPIAETDISQTFREIAGKNFDRDRYVSEAEKKIREYKVETPDIPRADKDSVRLVDLSYTVSEDVYAGGAVIRKKGTVLNPLENMKLSRTYVIMNGADTEQTEWWKNCGLGNQYNTVLLITGGYAFEVMEKVGRQIYYATSEIITKFQVTALPAVIRQKYDMLEVRQIDIKKSDAD